VTLTFDFLTMKVVSESRVTCMDYLCANFGLPIGLSVLDLGQMYATDVRQTDVRQKHRFAFFHDAAASKSSLCSVSIFFLRRHIITRYVLFTLSSCRPINRRTDKLTRHKIYRPNSADQSALTDTVFFL